MPKTWNPQHQTKYWLDMPIQIANRWKVMCHRWPPDMPYRVNKLFGAEDFMFLALIHQKLKKKIWPLRRIFLGQAPLSSLHNFQEVVTSQFFYMILSIIKYIPKYWYYYFRQFCWGEVGGHGKKNSSERSKFFFEVRVIKCQKQQILSTKQFIDSMRYDRSL